MHGRGIPPDTQAAVSGYADAVDERTQNNKGLYRRRQEIVEHVFGTVKAVWGYKQFLCRTKPKVCAEVSLAYLAYIVI